MEYLAGEDLAPLVTSHAPMPAARAIHLGTQACRALEEAHALELVHRDVKPGNLCVTTEAGERDRLKLVDFGIARSVAPTDEAVTVDGGLSRVRGTPAYMAPEACRGEDVGPAADLYGLGATLYHLLVGAPPFTGDQLAVLHAHVNTPPRDPSSLDAKVPQDLAAVVLRCLAKSPAERFATAAELRTALEQCADAGRWSPDDAARFWEKERPASVQRWSADTVA